MITNRLVSLLATAEIDIAWLDHIDDGMECTTFTHLAKSLHKREVENSFMGESQLALDTK